VEPELNAINSISQLKQIFEMNVYSFRRNDGFIPFDMPKRSSVKPTSVHIALTPKHRMKAACRNTLDNDSFAFVFKTGNNFRGD
jgi:hypothetical protein